jgi:hypothetical protein
MLSEASYHNMTVGRIPSVEGGIQPTIVDAKGDLIAATGNDSPNRLAVGANNLVLTADSAEATGLKWAAPDPLTTKGDLFTYSTTEARLGVGANDTVLTADSTAATGLKWATPAGGAANWSLLNAGGTSLSGTTVTISGISGIDKIMILINQASSSSTASEMRYILNGDTGTNYNSFGGRQEWLNTYATNVGQSTANLNSASIILGQMGNNSASSLSSYLSITGCNASGVKVFQGASGVTSGGGAAGQSRQIGGWYTGTSTISSVAITTGSGSFDGGTIYVYASA